MTYLKDLWARVNEHWHVVLAALIAALPTLLDYLGVIDLKPIMILMGASEDLSKLIINILPFVLAFIKPMLVVEPAEVE